MQHIAISSTSLATGIKYPAPVAKANAEQEQAATAYRDIIVKISEAEALLAEAEADDKATLEAAAAAGTGAPGKEKAPAAAKNLAYIHEVGNQVQERYINAAGTLRDALAENAENILPLAIEKVRQSLASYDECVTEIHHLVTSANEMMQNAAHSLNLLRPYIPYLAYTVNWVPARAHVQTARELGNIGQIADRLERAQAEKIAPSPQPDRWPVPVGKEPDEQPAEA